jgi:hypothetical protein
MGLLSRIVKAALVGAIVFILCMLFGGLLALIPTPPTAFLGHFIEQWAVAFAVIAALWVLAGGSIPALLPA